MNNDWITVFSLVIKPYTAFTMNIFIRFSWLTQTVALPYYNLTYAHCQIINLISIHTVYFLKVSEFKVFLFRIIYNICITWTICKFTNLKNKGLNFHLVMTGSPIFFTWSLHIRIAGVSITSCSTLSKYVGTYWIINI